VTIKISAKFHPLIYRLPPNITHPFEENAKLEETHNSKNSKEKKTKTSSAAGAAEITTHFSLATDYHSCNNNNNNNKIPRKSPLKRAD